MDFWALKSSPGRTNLENELLLIGSDENILDSECVSEFRCYGTLSSFAVKQNALELQQHTESDSWCDWLPVNMEDHTQADIIISC